MIPEEMQRTIQFLLDNQVGHDARLAKIEVSVDRLTGAVDSLIGAVDSLTGVTSALAVNQQELVNTQRAMQSEFREGLAAILTVSEQTQALTRQVATAVVQLADTEARTIRRVNALENRVDVLENSGE